MTPNLIQQIKSYIAALPRNERHLTDYQQGAQDARNTIAVALEVILDAEVDAGAGDNELCRYRDLCGAMYQAAGAYDLPVRFLDALSDASTGAIEARQKTGSLLPCYPPHASMTSAKVEKHEPDCNLNMASLKRQIMGCDCRLSGQLPTHPQPVRSVVVSAGNVRSAAVAYSKRATDGSQDVNFHDCIRAALENFANSLPACSGCWG